jgi:hypothetical protein
MDATNCYAVVCSFAAKILTSSFVGSSLFLVMYYGVTLLL